MTARKAMTHIPSEEAGPLSEKTQENKIFTIPNMLSMLRIALIPVIVWLYHVKGEFRLAAGLLIASGVTDVVDGLIARHFNMVSNLGKALDPIADKLTQTAVLICLLPQFPMMWTPLGLLVIKEFISAIWKLRVIHKTKQIDGAQWHGKTATVLLFATILFHVLWPAIPPMVSIVCIIVCSVMMFLSFLLYSLGNYRAMNAR